ncbi:MAG: hypothetical protein HOP33_21555 [Verrucomicrobia bacterium]|nr:hypothetical protein [Verrucomicrobiota bacterium]
MCYWIREQSNNQIILFTRPVRATFPAGTVSGGGFAPCRSSLISQASRRAGRGPYGGCVGYFSFNGNLDTCPHPGPGRCQAGSVPLCLCLPKAGGYSTPGGCIWFVHVTVLRF